MPQPLGKGAEQAALETVQRVAGRRLVGESLEVGREPPRAGFERGFDRTPGEPGVERGREAVERGAALGVAGGRQGAIGHRRRTHEERHLLDHGELLVLLVGHVVGDRQRAVDLVEAFEPRRQILGRGDTVDEHVERPRRALALAQQIAQRGHRFGGLVVEIERVEVEPGQRHERHRARRQHGGDDAHRVPPPHGQTEQSARGLAAARATAGSRRGSERPQAQQRGKHRVVGEQADEHAGPRDQAEFGNPGVVGRDEHVEARGGGRGAQEQGAADVAPGGGERVRVRPARVHEFAVSQAHVDAEGDAEADEQHGERDRDEIELADRERGEARGPYQPDRQGDERRRHQPYRTQPEEKDETDEDEGDRGRQRGAPAGGRELVVRQRDASREPHAHAIFGDQRELPGERADRLDRRLVGGEAGEVAPRLQHDEPPAVVDRRGLARYDLLPGQMVAASGERRFDRVAQAVERVREVELRRLAVGDVVDRFLENREQAAEARVLDQLADQRLHPGEVVGKLPERVEVEIE